MPRRHVFQHVIHAQGSRPSGRLLDRALIARNYSGPRINWGNANPRFGEGHPSRDGRVVNTPNAVSVASNKRIALNTMHAAGVPVPNMDIAQDYPFVMRTDRHHAGSGFWLCRNEDDVARAIRGGATHRLAYIGNAREFRVHIVNGLSIKLTEKLRTQLSSRGPVEPNTRMVIRSHANGWRHMAPQPNAHRVSLRNHARAAVAALGLDFGAVDILMRDTDRIAPHEPGDQLRFEVEFFVLEVNTAPGFQAELDTCDRYADAFLRMTR